MGDTNLAWVNTLKKHYLDILTCYEGESKKLKNEAVRRCYEALLIANTVEQFRQWRLMMEDFGLAFTNMDAPVMYENPMGILDDIAEGAPDGLIKTFLDWKKTVNPKRLMETRKQDAEIVAILRKAVERPEDMTIRVFPCGNRWAAIDKDADRIFEAFGWQTGCVWDGEDLVSWIFIGNAGLEVLQNSDYDVKVMDFGEFDITYIYFEEDIISTVQQMMDYNRMLGKDICESRKLMMRLQPYAAMCHGYKELMSANITIEDNKLYGEMPDGSKVLLNDGKSWRLDDVGRQMVMQMGAQMGAAPPY